MNERLIVKVTENDGKYIVYIERDENDIMYQADTKNIMQEMVCDEIGLHFSEVVFSVSDFAKRMATVLLESQSSTALFFVQQSYPDNVDGLEQMNFQDLLTTVKNNAEQILQKH